MMAQETKPASPEDKQVKRKLIAALTERDNIHFGLAFAVLVITGTFVHAYGWIIKKPIPWPEGVKVNDLHRNVSLPDAFGPYIAIPEDDPYYRQSENRAGPDLIINEDNLKTLGMRTIDDDQERIAQRNSNWYGIRMYRDTQKDQYSPFLYWQLEVYYYTGLRDQVPHVPNTCLIAGGADILKESSVELQAPDAREPWNRSLAVQQVFYTAESGGMRIPYVTYYFLGFNDEPIIEKSPHWARLKVRNRMSSREVYNYFVKIQFSPLRGPATPSVVSEFKLDEADQAAQEFIADLLPAIIEQFPTRESIQKLEQAEQAKDN